MPTNNLSLMDYTDTGSLQKGIGQGASTLFGQGSDTVASGKKKTDTGFDTFAPLISRFMKIVTGDASEIDAASAPEISGTKDSYQAARDAVTNFTPRGGGLSSAMSANRTQEASDISKIRASVRSNADTSLAEIGKALMMSGISEQQIGLGVESASLGDFAKLLDAAIKQDENSSSFWGSIGGVIGKLLGGLGAGGGGKSSSSPSGSTEGDPVKYPEYGTGPYIPPDPSSGGADTPTDGGDMGNYGDGNG